MVRSTPTIVGTPTTFQSQYAVLSYTIDKPAVTLEVGDVLIMSVRGQTANSLEPIPSGFTRIGPAWTTDNSSSRTNGWYAKVVSDPESEPSTYTGSRTSGSGRWCVALFVVRGVDTDTMVSGHSDSYDGVSISNGRRSPSYSVTAPSLQLFMIGAEFSASVDYSISSTPSGMSVVSHVTTDGASSSAHTVLWTGSIDLGVATTAAQRDLQFTVAPSGAAASSVSLYGKDVVSEPPEESSITLVGTPVATTSNASATEVVVTRPTATLQNGDTIIVALTQQVNSTNAFESSGFTRLGPTHVNDGTGRTVAFFAKRVTDAATENGISTYTFSRADGGGRFAVICAIYRGVHPDIIDGYASPYRGADITNGIKTNTFTTVGGGLQLVLFGSTHGANNTHVATTLPDATVVGTALTNPPELTASRNYAWLGSKTVAAGTVPELSVVWPAVPPGRGIQSIVLKPLGEEPVPGYPVLLGEEPARLFVQGSSELVTPTHLQDIAIGFDSIAQMKATHGFTWAHRGGGGRYAEMSMHAYTQAARIGYGALEISMQRSSDGVWFGNHDANLNSTSLGASTAPVSGMTWAQIQEVMNAKCADGRPQPYTKVEDVIEAYKDTHVIILDIKESFSNSSHREEYYDLCRQVGPERCIVKFFYTESNLVTWANNNGYESWGYIYSGDMDSDANYASRLAPWTMWGLNIGASQSYWDTLSAAKGSRSLIGHIASSQEMYDTGMSKGADGIQCSHTHLITPVSRQA